VGESYRTTLFYSSLLGLQLLTKKRGRLILELPTPNLDAAFQEIWHNVNGQSNEGLQFWSVFESHHVYPPTVPCTPIYIPIPIPVFHYSDLHATVL